jgi:hypothetical protein
MIHFLDTDTAQALFSFFSYDDEMNAVFSLPSSERLIRHYACPNSAT